MLRRVALVRTDDSEERIASIIRVKRIVELGTSTVTNKRSALRKSTIGDFCHPDDGRATFLRNVGSYNSHTA
jgi:hypothetical protein